MAVQPLKSVTNLAEAGWGVIFAPGVSPAVREALAPLLDLRRREATLYDEANYRELDLEPGESLAAFLKRHGSSLMGLYREIAQQASVQQVLTKQAALHKAPQLFSRKMGKSSLAQHLLADSLENLLEEEDAHPLPHYLLIVGGPDAVPFAFQKALGVAHAVGRLHFERVEEYARYAQSVVDAELPRFALPRNAALFGAQSPDDQLTELTSGALVAPLGAHLRERQSAWEIDAFIEATATRAQLRRLLGGAQTPALLLTAGHGLGFPPEDARRRALQGALLCSDWPGPRQWQQAIPPDFYLAAEDVGDDARLMGLIAVHLASYSAGTSCAEEAACEARAFVARLPQRLLSHPRGGALAVVGLVDRAWGYAYNWDRALAGHREAYAALLDDLLEGQRVGQAMAHLTERFAALAAALNDELRSLEFGGQPDAAILANLWAHTRDLQNHVILGDPAARLKVIGAEAQAAERPTLRPAILAQPKGVAPFPPEPPRYADLAEAGWGVIFHAEDMQSAALHLALDELLKHRKRQATSIARRRYQVYLNDGYRPGESAADFLARHGAGQGPVVPEKVPYYLLIVGGPESIPYEFEYALAVRHAVGRIDFGDDHKAYRAYAHSVVRAEREGVSLPHRATVFATQNPGDKATLLGLNYLAKPLAQHLEGHAPDWQVQRVLREDATKAHLSRLLGGQETPALLLTVSHGMEWPNGHPNQLARQGALVCQDWPGPGAAGQKLPPDFYFAADDVTEKADLHGLVACLWCSYGAGTPKLDDFFAQAFKEEPDPIAPYAFVARLPQRLLSHPQGGALAVLGHVERPWGYSFMDAQDVSSNQVAWFEATLDSLLAGQPAGLGQGHLNQRYAEIAAEWATQEAEAETEGVKADNAYRYARAARITRLVDARNYVIVGDPAVRVMGRGPAVRVIGREPAVRVMGRGPASPPPATELAPITAHRPIDFAAPEDGGWGVIFAAGDERAAALREALEPLLALRREQAGAHYAEFDGGYGYRPGDTARDFLARQGASPNAVDPARVPYFLLLVGDPERIPFAFQYELDIHYAVGRLDFGDDRDAYARCARYARSVVREGARLPRRAALFGPTSPGDRATELSATYLVEPLLERLRKRAGDGAAGWEIAAALRQQADKASLARLLGGAETPALLFTAGHVLEHTAGDEHQMARQGALLCSDWPGPPEAVEAAHAFAAEDLGDDAHLHSMIAFLWGGPTAGTPRLDSYRRTGETAPALAPRPFTSRLPQRLLSHPNGGALAVLGQVERAWGYCFLNAQTREPRIDTFYNAMARLMAGYPVGVAAQHFKQRYIELATEWAALKLPALNKTMDTALAHKESQLRAELIAARNYVILGDPAARVRV